MTKIKKGTKVYEFRSWDHKGTVCIREFTVQSMGKQQGTVSFTENGKMVEMRIYASSAYNLIPVADCADPIAYGLKLAAVLNMCRVFDVQGKIRHYGYPETHNYTKAMRKEIAELHAPRAATDSELSAEIAARVAARVAAAR